MLGFRSHEIQKDTIMKKLTILLAMAGVVPLMTVGRASAQDAYGYDS